MGNGRRVNWDKMVQCIIRLNGLVNQCEVNSTLSKNGALYSTNVDTI